MIILKKLRWGNCFSYGEDNEIDLQANPITQLVGVNGAGKTSIPLLIQEVLFGKNTRNIKKQDISNRYTDIPGYWIILLFEKYESTYEINLQRSKSKLTLTLSENGLDISSHTAIATYKTIADIIGFSDFKMVSQLLYQSSTTNLEFLTATDTNRKKFLISLLKLDTYLSKHEVFKVACRDISKDILSASAALEQIRSWIAKHENMSLTKKESKKKILIPARISEDISIVKDRISRIKVLNKQIVDNNQYKKELAALDIESFSKDIVRYDKEAVAQLNEKMGGLKASSNSAGATKRTFSNLDGIKECPNCFQEVDTENVANILKSATDEIHKYALEIQQLQAELKGWEEIRLEEVVARKTEASFVRLNTVIDEDVAVEVLDEGVLSAEYKSLRNELYQVEKEANEVIEYNTKVSAFNAKVDVISSQLSEFRTDANKKSKVLDAATEEKSYVELLKSAFSTNGLLSYKIESSVKVLEDSINEYLSEFCFFRLVFLLEKEKLNVDIIDDAGSLVAIETLSTGELARVNISTILAIRKVMTTLANSNINFLFLDEIVGVLDDAGKEKLSEILIKENLNTFIVSHESTHPLIPIMVIEKTNNISRLTDGR
ncbi:MAG: hypothetical protein GY810_28430 [Aureispira sp.]|nr:hypothetical protein [Aureispira sp.]